MANIEDVTEDKELVGVEVTDEDGADELNNAVTEEDLSVTDDIAEDESSAAPRQISIPVAPALTKTGDLVWGKSDSETSMKSKHHHSELDDLFEVPESDDNDMYVDDLFEVDDQTVDLDDDLSDLTQVTDEDIMGKAPVRKAKKTQRRSGSQSGSTPTSLGGVQ